MWDNSSKKESRLVTTIQNIDNMGFEDYEIVSCELWLRVKIYPLHRSQKVRLSYMLVFYLSFTNILGILKHQISSAMLISANNERNKRRRKKRYNREEKMQ